MITLVDPAIEGYAISKSTTPSPLLKELFDYTCTHVEMAQMLIGEMEASFLGFLIHSLQVKSVLEIGTFTGYSALAMAEQLPEDGRLITLDNNSETSQIAKNFWARSEHGKKIESILAQAVDTIAQLHGPFDLVFIDADKQNYQNYFNLVLPKLSKKGVIVLDNVLWSGRVLEKGVTDSATQALQEINDWIAQQDDLYATMLPIRDGIFVITKI